MYNAWTISDTWVKNVRFVIAFIHLKVKPKKPDANENEFIINFQQMQIVLLNFDLCANNGII